MTLPHPDSAELSPSPNRAGRYGSVTSPFWQANDATLTRLVEVDRLTANVAAERLGVSKNSVIGRAGRLGLRWARSPSPKAKAYQRLEFPKNGCLWLHGHVGEPDAHFCGEFIADGAYCEAHRKRVYVRAGSVEE